MQKALNQIQWAVWQLCTEAVGGSGQHLLETEDSATLSGQRSVEVSPIQHPSQMSPQPHLIPSLGPSNLDVQQFSAGCASFFGWSDPVYSAVEYDSFWAEATEFLGPLPTRRQSLAKEHNQIQQKSTLQEIGKISFH